MAHSTAARTHKRRADSDRLKAASSQTHLRPAQRRALIIERLEHAYPGATTALHFRNTFQLLVAVILSAQCTDARVNLTTPSLFACYPNAAALAAAKRRDVERIIKSCGFFRVKAANLIAASKMLVERYGGKVPTTIEELLELPGVGRKTANVILAVAYHQDAIPVDTHVFRVANRLGLARAPTAASMERALMRVIPKEQWSALHHVLIHHGRQICHAQRPACAQCPVMDLCPSAAFFLRKERATAQRTSARREKSSG